MICGIDVWHGSGKSILGFTASLDSNFSKYTSDVKTQDLKDELGKEVSTSVMTCLEAFKSLNNMYPKRLIIYRDGVSKGQFSTVQKQECNNIKQSLTKKNIDCKLVYIIVNKRVDTKIINKMRNEGCAEGTVVDECVTEKDMYDFFMVPLASRQGLANPI